MFDTLTAEATRRQNRPPDRFASIIDVHVILRRAGRVLLLRRAGDVYATGQLCLPSGHLEHGESICQAAVREAFEETGIALGPATLRHVLSIHQRNPGTCRHPDRVRIHARHVGRRARQR